MFFSCARKISAVCLISLALTGCFDKEETHSVEWFSNHNAERAETVKRCSDNPGELGNTPNCKNAIAAEQKASSGSLRHINNW